MLTFPIREVSSAKEALAERGFDPESQLRVSEGISPSSSLSFLKLDDYFNWIQL